MQGNINISAVIHSKEAVALSEDQKKPNIKLRLMQNKKLHKPDLILIIKIKQYIFVSF